MNAVGRDMDLRTLVHEGGHAFHMLAAREEPLLDYRSAPIEFCEVASMGWSCWRYLTWKFSIGMPRIAGAPIARGLRIS